MYAADECFGGRELNRGIELCAVVEQMYSLEVSFRVTGELALLDRIERIAFNALPGTMTADMWQHQYLQQANEVSACPTNPHVWQSDGPDSTLFGVEPNFGCCTANFNQGWPKLAANALLTRAVDGGVVVGLLLPVAATLPSGAKVTVDTSYPLSDTVNVTLEVPASAAATPLYVRVPGWADAAAYSTYSTDGAAGSHANKKAPNGTFVRAECAPGGRLHLRLSLNPTIRIETGWGGRAGRRTNPQAGVDADGYSLWGGSVMPAGGDVHIANMSISEAKAWCASSAACVGFSMRAAAGTDSVAAAAGQLAPEIEPAAHNDETHDHRHGTPEKRARPPPPSSPYEVMPRTGAGGHSPRGGPPPSSPQTVYFKGAWNPEPNPQWISYAKARDVRDTNAVAVLRGPLLFALRLKQSVTTVKTWQPFRNTDVNISTPSAWNYAVLLDPQDATKSFTFERQPVAGVGFNSSSPTLLVRASAIKLGEWRAALNAADEPPPSPMVRPEGAVEEVELVPYGATELRMGALPWVVAS
jgi:hypothetical protein